MATVAAAGHSAPSCAVVSMLQGFDLKCWRSQTGLRAPFCRDKTTVQISRSILDSFDGLFYNYGTTNHSSRIKVELTLLSHKACLAVLDLRSSSLTTHGGGGGGGGAKASTEEIADLLRTQRAAAVVQRTPAAEEVQRRLGEAVEQRHRQRAGEEAPRTPAQPLATEEISAGCDGGGDGARQTFLDRDEVAGG